MTKQSPLIILSAGGTGGHIMPAQSLAHDLIARGYRVEIITDSRGLKFTKGFGTIKLHEVSAGTFGKGLPKLALGIAQSIAIILKSKPAAIVGFGGYPSFPGVLAAQLLLKPTILHEQNAIVGKANKALACLATKIALSWPNSRGLSDKQRAKSTVTGNPIRTEIAKIADTPFPPITDTLNILVMGGSLGATVFSKILPQAFAQLPPENRAMLNITQQCREADIPEVKAAYEAANIKATLMTFIDDVATEITNAHLFIGRSGASTVAEISAAGRPAIFVPYPHHADQQQKINADAIADNGGAWTIEEKDFTIERVKTHIEQCLAKPSTLSSAAAKAKACANPNAAAKLAELVETLINTKG